MYITTMNDLDQKVKGGRGDSLWALTALVIALGFLALVVAAAL